MIVYLTDAKHIDGYRVWVRFNNGVEGEVDLEDRLFGPIFEPLKDPEAFRQVAFDPELETIAWPNGADIAPEFLFERVQAAKKSA